MPAQWFAATICLLLLGALLANAEDFAASGAVAHKTATQVVDSKNHVVGTLEIATTADAANGMHNQTAALVGINGRFFLMGVSPQGFTETANDIEGSDGVIFRIQ